MHSKAFGIISFYQKNYIFNNIFVEKYFEISVEKNKT